MDYFCSSKIKELAKRKPSVTWTDANCRLFRLGEFESQHFESANLWPQFPNETLKFLPFSKRPPLVEKPWYI